MCGRFAMNKETEDLISEFVAAGGDVAEWRPVYSIAPTDPAPIVRERSRGEETLRQVDVASWGLRPSWAKPGGPSPINARLESVATNGMFKSAFASQRCIVPMLGYYEWAKVSDGKQPYFLRTDADLLAAAGLYTARKEGDRWALTFTIITREARDASGEVHDRMPVFLTEDTWDAWLSPVKITDPTETLATLDRSSVAVAATMSGYPVDRKVNSVQRVDPFDPTVIEPISLAG